MILLKQINLKVIGSKLNNNKIINKLQVKSIIEGWL